MYAEKTPLAKIDYIYKGKSLSIYAKLEYYNPTGSIKDRIADYIISRAEAMGELKKGQPIVEVTSGNTGIAFSAIAARKGCPIHIFMPSWASKERKDLMTMYGAVLHEVTREEGGFKECFVRAEALAKEIGAYMPRQFDNPANAEAHYLGTGQELVKQLPSVTDFVSGVGTGGTIMGTGRAVKEHNPAARITALEPDSMPLLCCGIICGPHKIEGIGDDFVPSIVDKSLFDDIIEISDSDAIAMSAQFSRRLGLGVGISSGANFLAAVLVNAAAPGRTVATVFADDNKKYLTTGLISAAPVPGMLSAEIELVSAEIMSRAE